MKKKFEEITLSFTVKTGEGDKVFGSVSPKQIAEQLDELGYKIDKKQIKIKDSLSALGYHNVDIELHKKVIATIKVFLTK
jgi:large subunit ribosomal protein L9